MTGVQPSLTMQQKGLTYSRGRIGCPWCRKNPNEARMAAANQSNLYHLLCPMHQKELDARLADRDFEPWRTRGYLVYDEHGRLVFSMDLAKRYRRETAPRYGRGWRTR